MTNLYLVFENQDSMDNVIKLYFDRLKNKKLEGIYFLDENILKNSFEDLYEQVHFFTNKNSEYKYCLQFGNVVKTNNKMKFNNEMLKNIGKILKQDFEDDKIDGVQVLYVEYL